MLQDRRAAAALAEGAPAHALGDHAGGNLRHGVDKGERRHVVDRRGQLEQGDIVDDRPLVGLPVSRVDDDAPHRHAGAAAVVQVIAADQDIHRVDGLALDAVRRGDDPVAVDERTTAELAEGAIHSFRHERRHPWVGVPGGVAATYDTRCQRGHGAAGQSQRRHTGQRRRRPAGSFVGGFFYSHFVGWVLGLSPPFSGGFQCPFSDTSHETRTVLPTCDGRPVLQKKAGRYISQR